MNYASRSVKPVPTISLAEQEDFVLGDLAISPSIREVRIGESRETVEPRVMQVLVVLAQAQGAVVSRDQLIERCWGGRIVGDDAVNNCVGKVRALAALAPQPAFEIETIPRVGYRLREPAAPSVVAPRAPATAKPTTSAHLPRALLWFGAAIAVLVAAVAAMFVFAPQPREWVIVESHLPFISTPLIERYPAFSPDGTMIAYSAGPDVFTRKLYLRLKTGADPIALTNDSFDSYSPQWSPDGSTIAYLGYAEKQTCRIMLVPVPSGASRQVGRCRTSTRSSLAWDRNGRALLYEDSPSANLPPRILRLDLNSGATTEITHPVAAGSLEDSAPSVSPDGKTMLFTRELSAVANLIVLHTQANGSEHVLLQDLDDLDAAWSADSSVVFVARETLGDSSLWAYPVTGAAPWRITTSPIPISRLSSGPDGLLAMELEFDETDLAAASAVPGQEPRLLDKIGLNACKFDYAPDGTLALLAHHSGTASIWLREPDGRFHELLGLNTDPTCGIRWSPDGTRFAYGQAASDGFVVAVVDRSGAPVARIRNPTRSFGWIDWSADGKSLLLSRLDARGWRLWRTDLGHPDKSVPVLPYGWECVQAHGGMLFGIKDGTAGIWRIDGKPQRLTDWPTAEYPWLWTVSGGRIVYPDFSNPGHPIFMAQPIGGGASIPIGYPTGFSVWGNIAVDPRSGQVSYVRWKRDDTDIGWVRLARR